MHMPDIGLGTFRLQEQALINSVRAGLALGYRHIDTAQVYGNEADVGQAVAESGVAREEIFVTTKIWLDNLSGDRLLPSLQQSLVKLRMAQVDLALIHWPPAGDAAAIDACMRALMEAKERGLARHVGVSNFTVAQLTQAVRAVGAANIYTNQVEIHPFLQNRRLLDAMRSLGIHATAYMPLAYGKVMHDPVLREIAASHNATAAQVALAWILQQGHSVIPSSTRRENQQANLDARGLRLTQDDLASIARLDRDERIANPDFAPAWD